jgi:8-oxo-dGTP pyrophosphatase MutT (NUDIX family)
MGAALGALVTKLGTEIQKGLPGESAQFLMVPGNRPFPDPYKQSDYRSSAVCIVLCEDPGGNIFIPLILRRTYDGHHSGQVGFPGGKFDESDGDLERTALRECEEEIGLKDLKVIGKLSPLHIPVSLFHVHPFLTYCQTVDPVLVSHEREVEAIVRLPLSLLSDDKIVGRGKVQVREREIDAPWFEVNGHRVWGATAMMLSELKEMLKKFY